MTRSAINPTYPSYLPRGWRVVTIAGVTTVGLGIGLVQPALAEWMKQSAKPPARSNTRPIPAENGFTATIRRLMSDSRRAAEQGDYAKAVQLAERAAKLSEATAQLLGPTSECSPQETSRLLAEMRAAQAGTAPVLAAQPKSTPTAPQLPNRNTASSPAIAATNSNAPAAKPTVKGGPALPTAPGQAQSVVASGPKSPSHPAAQSKPQVGATGTRPAEGQAPGNVAIAGGPRGGSSNQASQAGRTQVKSPQTQVPPAPARESSTSDQLLSKSRQAAADGDLDRAIELAKEAAGVSPAPSFFGAGGSRPQNTEATRWLERLVAQRDTQSQPTIARHNDTSVEVFEPPIKVASKLPQKNRGSMPVVEPAGNLAVSENAQQATGVEAAVASRAAPSPTPDLQSPNSPEVDLWSEELPEAKQPATSVAHEPVKFSRRPIDASAGWVDADALDRAAGTSEPRPTVAETQLVTEQIPGATAGIEPDEATPEFSIGDVPVQADAREIPDAEAEPDPVQSPVEVDHVEPAAEIPTIPEVTPDGATLEETQPVSERGPLRLRQHISQVPEMDLEEVNVGTKEEVVVESVAQSPSAVTERPPLRFRKNPVHTAELTEMAPSESVSQPQVADSAPPTRGTLRLRPQIQQVGGEIVGIGREDSHASQRPAETANAASSQSSKSLPHTFADISSESIQVVAEENTVDAPVQRFPVQRVLRLRERIKEASALNPGGQLDQPQRETNTEEPASSEQTPDQHRTTERDGDQPLTQGATPSTARPAIKLRERTRLKLDDPTSNSSSTLVPRVAIKTRQPVVARSESNLWKSVDSQQVGASSPVLENDRSDRTDTAAAQPILPPPITQARFEATDSGSTDLQKTALNANETSAQSKSDFDIAPPPPATAESHPWHEDDTQEKGSWTSEGAVRKSSFALIDQLADAFNIPAKTLVSLIMGAGAVLLAGGLLAMRAAMQRRHSA